MPRITGESVLVKQTQETDNGIIPTPSGDDCPLTGETHTFVGYERRPRYRHERSRNLWYCYRIESI